MNINLQQLPAHLENNFRNIYFVSGDEPFQKEQALKLLRQSASQNGFTERIILETDDKFDWGQLLAESQSLSLFGDKRLLELRIATGKPGDKGSKAIVAFLEQCPDDVMLLIVSGKIEKQQQKSKWYKAIDEKGVCIQVWPIEKAQLPDWIKQRLASLSMNASQDALSLLADRFEGNLLAANQELEKLFLLHGEGEIDTGIVREFVADSARYNVFQLVDTCLAGDANQSVKILEGLRAEGISPVIIVWALTREIRLLAKMAQEIPQKSMQQVLQSHYVWQKRQSCVKSALQRHGIRQWQLLLWQISELDKLNKGLKAGNIWHELIQLAMKIAGLPLMSAQSPKSVAYSQYL